MDIQKFKKTLLYSHGAVPVAAILAVMEKFGQKMPHRNALFFDTDGPEKEFQRVFVDEGEFTDQIVEAYKKLGAEVEVVKAGKEPKGPDPKQPKAGKEPKKFDPDAEPAEKDPKAQGSPDKKAE